MDFISKPAIEITTLALDGLSSRHKVLASNIANADTPGFKRSDVNFEDQLGKILNNENTKQKEKEDYSASLMYYPSSIVSAEEESESGNFIYDDKKANYNDFQPEVVQTDDPNVRPDGNNTSIEHEMSQLTQNGMRYTALATLQGKMLKEIQDVIKGGGA